MNFLYELENTLYDNVEKAPQAGLFLPDKLGKYWMTHNLWFIIYYLPLSSTVLIVLSLKFFVIKCTIIMVNLD